jgi:hypothetical protein
MQKEIKDRPRDKKDNRNKTSAYLHSANDFGELIKATIIDENGEPTKIKIFDKKYIAKMVEAINDPTNSQEDIAMACELTNS